METKVFCTKTIFQKFLVFAMFLLSGIAGRAQEDVTAQYLTNADFEDTYSIYEEQPKNDRAIYQPKGWEIDWASNGDDLTALTEADLYAQLITGSFTMVDTEVRGAQTYWTRLKFINISSPRLRIYQSVTVPAGKYRLSADMLQYNESGADNGAHLFAGTNTKASPASSVKSDEAGWHRVELEFSVVETTTLNVGFSVVHTVNLKEHIVGVDNFKLEYLGEPDEEEEEPETFTSKYLVNPSFEYIAEGTPWTATWRGDPWGWSRQGDLIGNSFGISNDASDFDGAAICWYRSVPMPEFFELSQTVEGLPAGKYVVSCQLACFSNMISNQRLFANDYAQYYAGEAYYDKNLGDETYRSFAGHAAIADATKCQLKPLSVEILLCEGEPLKLGIRSGSLMSDGSISTAGAGWFKVDDFRLDYQGYDVQDFLNELRLYIEEATDLLEKNISDGAREKLTDALTAANAVDDKSENTAIKEAADNLKKAIAAAKATIEGGDDNPDNQPKEIKLVMDMVHHNPGDKQYDSRYNNPATLAAMGYNAKCFYLFDSPTLAINWDGYDPNVLPEGSADRAWVEAKAKRLNSLYDECKENGIDVFAMCDLVLLPKRLVALKNIASTYGDPTNETTQELLRYQIQQSFAQFPQLDGLVVRIGETYLEDAPYHQGNIQNKTDADRCIIPLMQLLREEICVKLNKRLVFRTWMSFDENPLLYSYVSKSVEPHENLYIGIKHCEGDFHRGNDFSDVLATGRHQQIVEVQCAREYEGKGAFPNYVARGVIDGFEEHQSLQEAGNVWNLREVHQSGRLTGMWTWTRGGGWEGPYVKDELWCDMNAWVMAQWALHPESDEESLFKAYCTERLQLDEKGTQQLRDIALLSEHAVIRGLRSAQYPDKVFSMWVRDEYITFPSMPADKTITATILNERDEAVADWEKIAQIAQEFNSNDVALDEVVKVTCEYGSQMFRIFRSVGHVAAIHQQCAEGDMIPYFIEYFDAWKKLDALAADYPSSCPTLFNREKVLRTSSTVAHKMMMELSHGDFEDLKELVKKTLDEAVLGVNTGQTSQYAIDKLQAALDAASVITDENSVEERTKAYKELNMAYEEYLNNGRVPGGAPNEVGCTDVTTDFLVEADKFSRADAGVTTRFASPANWTVENFKIPNGNDGIKNGLDKYPGYDCLSLGVWNDRGNNEEGSLSDARIYRKVHLAAGRYYFGASYNTTYNVSSEAYLFASSEILPTEKIPVNSIAYYAINNAPDGVADWHGLYFTLPEDQDVYLGFQMDLNNGSATQEFRAKAVKLLYYGKISIDELKELVGLIETELSGVKINENTGYYNKESHDALMNIVSEAKSVSDDAMPDVVSDMYNKLMDAYADFKANGKNAGGKPDETGSKDITVEKLTEAENFSRTEDCGTLRFGTPKYWTVENILIDKGTEGMKNGLDKYSGKDCLMLGVWNDRDDNQEGDIADARVYQRIHLDKGRYYFGGQFDALYRLYAGYIFVAEELISTSEMETQSVAYYNMMDGAIDSNHYGVYFTLEEPSDVVLGIQADLSDGDSAQEVRLSHVMLLQYSDEPDAIEDVTVKENGTSKSEYYSLQGLRLKSAPAKGLYIMRQNGKASVFMAR